MASFCFFFFNQQKNRKGKQKTKNPQKVKTQKINLIHQGYQFLQSTSSKLSHGDLQKVLMQQKLNKRLIARSCFHLNNLFKSCSGTTRSLYMLFQANELECKLVFPGYQALQEQKLSRFALIRAFPSQLYLCSLSGSITARSKLPSF